MFGWLWWFLIGCVTGVGLLIYVVFSFLSRTEAQVRSEAERHRELIKASRAELPTPVISAQKDPQSRKVWVKVIATSGEVKDQALKAKPWVVAILKNNMILLCPDEQSACTSVICVDGCVVDILKNQRGKPLFGTKDPITLQHSDRDLLPSSRNCRFYFRSGNDKENFFFALQEAAGLSSHKAAAAVPARQKEFFQLLSTLVTADLDPAPDWVSALVARLFWNIHDAPAFRGFVRQKILKKIGKVKMPSWVHEVKVLNVSIGPEVPIVRNVKLLDASPDGHVRLDGEVSWKGRFNLAIEIVFVLQLPLAKNPTYIPFAVSADITSLVGKLQVAANPPPATKLWMGFHEEPELTIKIDTSIGGGKKSIHNLPHLAEIMVNKIKSELLERMLLPNMDDFPLPKIPKSAPVSSETTVSARRKDSGGESLPAVEIDKAVGELLRESSEGVSKSKPKSN